MQHLRQPASLSCTKTGRWFCPRNSTARKPILTMLVRLPFFYCLDPMLSVDGYLNCVANAFQLGITARDHGYSFIQSTPTVLKLDVRKVSQFPPAFPTKNSTLSFTGKLSYSWQFAVVFEVLHWESDYTCGAGCVNCADDCFFVRTENKSEIISFPESIDPDNTNLLPNEIGDPICYYIACKRIVRGLWSWIGAVWYLDGLVWTLTGGNAEIFKIVDKRNASTVRHPLDREKPPADLFFVVESTNDCTKQPDPIRSFIDCVDVDTSSLAYLNVSVEVRSVLFVLLLSAVSFGYLIRWLVDFCRYWTRMTTLPYSMEPCQAAFWLGIR